MDCSVSVWERGGSSSRACLPRPENPPYRTSGLCCLSPQCMTCERVKLGSGTCRFVNMGMDQYLLIPFLVGWTSIYQLFWCSPGVQGFDPLPYGLNPTVFSLSFIVHVSRTDTYAKKYLGERAYIAAIGVVDESDCHLVLETFGNIVSTT